MIKKWIIYLLAIVITLGNIFMIIKIKKHHKVDIHNIIFDQETKNYKRGTIPFTGQGKLKIEIWKMDVKDEGMTGPISILDNGKFLIPTSTGEVHIGEISHEKFSSKKIYDFSKMKQSPNDIFQIRDAKVLNNNIYLVTFFHDKKIDCYSLRMYGGDFLLKEKIDNLKLMWESQPVCNTGITHTPGELGGKLIIVDNSKLLLAVGGIENAELDVKKDMDYGKTIIFSVNHNNLISKKYFSVGHRNPSGLYLKQKSPLIAYETEHGPMGGDELNQLEFGKDYGWPFVSYGMDYDGTEVSKKKINGIIAPRYFSGDGYAEPLFTWIPDIGISSVVEIQNNKEFPNWNGDILVGSLSGSYESGYSIYRLHLNNRKINLMERINVGEKIRSLNIDKEGAIIFKTDNQKIGKVSKAH